MKRGFTLRTEEEKQKNIILYKETLNPKYREQIILDYANLVKIISSQLFIQNINPMYEKEDYEHFGILGLIAAIDKFDINAGVKFETFASIKIRGAIIDELRKTDIGRRTRDKQKEYNKLKEKALYELGPNYKRCDLLKIGNIDEEKLLDLERNSLLDTASSLNEIMETIAEFDIKDELFNTEENILKEELKNILANSLEILTEREREVISMIYYEELSSAEISKVLGITDSRVSQLHAKALNKIKTYLIEKENYI